MEADRSSSSSCRREVAIFTAMVTAEISNVGLSILFKVASNSDGISPYIFIVYSFALSALLLLPVRFFTHRSGSLPPLSFSIICQMGLLGLIGCVYTIAGYTAVKYSSPTLASTVSNLTPALTFILAILFRWEKISLQRKSTVAKIVGTMVSIAGASVATLFHGPSVIDASQPATINHRQFLSPPLPPPSSNSDWAIGGGLLVFDYTLVSIFYIAQAHVLSKYPSESTMTLVFVVSVSILSAPVCLVTEKSPSAWIIGSRVSLVCIFASGILIPAYYLIHSWGIHQKGPFFVAMFRPLSIMIAIAMDTIFLKTSLYLGSLIGGMLISIGFYTVVWGKVKEEKADDISDCIASQSPMKTPLLINYKYKEEEA